MFLPSWLRPSRPFTIRRRPRACRFVRLHLEQLEERLTPTTTLTAADATQLQADIATADNNPTQQYLIQLTGPSPYDLTAKQTITNTAGVTIQGAGQVINAASNSRVFQVSVGANVTFDNLTIQGGVATDDGSDISFTPAEGGGILDLGGNVTLTHVVVQNNMAIGNNTGANALGGGIYANGGTLTITNSVIQNNSAQGGLGSDTTSGHGRSGGSAFGGGLYTSGTSLQLTVLNTALSDNSVQGGQGSDGAKGAHASGEFEHIPPGVGGVGGSGGDALGGAVYLSSAPSASFTNSSISSDNRAIGGTGGTGGAGGTGGSGGIAVAGAAGGTGGVGGNAAGGGLYVAVSSSLSLINSTVATNKAIGGSGGAGGAGGPGGASGGAAGAKGSTGTGGNAEGGGVFDFSSGTVSLINDTVAFNSAQQGGGIAVSSYYSTTAPTLTNTLLESNTALNGPDYSGNVNANDSNNFVSNDSGATTFNPATNILNVSAPQLGPATIAANGTTYYPLLTGSQAINAGTNSVLPAIAAAEGVLVNQATDQIGNPRLVGPAIDIGSIEYPSQATRTTVSNVQATFNPAAQNITLTATVTSADGTAVNEGTVTFTVRDSNGNPVGSSVTVAVSNGQASATYTLPGGTPAGTYTIQAVYDDGSNGTYQGSSGTGTLTIVAANSKTTVSNVTAIFSPFTQTVTLSAAVTSNGVAVNEGQVLFTVTNLAGQVIGITSGSVFNGTATARFTVPAGLSPGTYTITATYSDPLGNYQGSSGTGTLTIIPAPTNTSVSNVTASYSPSTQTITLSATVTSDTSPVNEGTVTFTVSNSAEQVIGSVTADVFNGIASASIAIPGGLPPGLYLITATYSDGAGNYQGGSGIGTLIIVPAAPPKLSVSNASAPFTNEDPVISLSATVVANGVPLNEGQVQFVIAGLTQQPITVQVVNGQAQATFGVPPNTPLGNYAIIATYTDSAGNYQNSSGAGTLTVAASPTIVTINNTSIVYGLFGEQETLTAVVRNILGVVVNEGFVTFTDGGQTATAPIINGVATVTLNIPLMNENPFGSIVSLAFGDHSGNFLASTSLFSLEQSVMAFIFQMRVLQSLMQTNSGNT